MRENYNNVNDNDSKCPNKIGTPIAHTSVDDVACRVLCQDPWARQNVNKSRSQHDRKDPKVWLLMIQHHRQQNHQWNIEALPTTGTELLSIFTKVTLTTI